MADVWLAESRGPSGFSKRVALKTMRPHIATTPDFVKMFIHEASIAARLTHENIVQVFDFGELEGRYFIAMEYVAGRSLRQIGRRYRELGRPIDLWFLVRTVIEVCKALRYVHTFGEMDGPPLGLVHRDVSPENVLVSFTGAVKLVDFGVSCAAELDPAVTEPGMLVGKCRYMAPERIHDPQGVSQSDLYSVGVMLYEYTTGRVPYAGENDGVILARILEATPPAPREIVPELPSKLERIILRAIHKDPKARFASASELAQELRTFLEHYDGTALLRPLDAQMGTVFSEATEIPSYVRLAASRATTAGDTLIDVVVEELSEDALVADDSSRPAVAPAPSAPPRETPPAGAHEDDVLARLASARPPTPSAAPSRVPSLPAPEPSSRGADALFDVAPARSSIPSAFGSAEPPPPPPAPPSTPAASSSRSPFGDDPPASSQDSPFGYESSARFIESGSIYRDAFSIASTRGLPVRDVFSGAARGEADGASNALREWGILASPSSPPPASANAAYDRDEPREQAATRWAAPQSAPGTEAFNRGLRHLAAKDYGAALEAFREAVAATPENRTYRSNLKRLEEKLGREPDR